MSRPSRDFSENQFLSCSHSQVMLEAETTNEGALRLYERLGFIRDKRLHKYAPNQSKMMFPLPRCPPSHICSLFPSACYVSRSTPIPTPKHRSSGQAIPSSMHSWSDVLCAHNLVLLRRLIGVSTGTTCPDRTRSG
eukprot:6460770-Pyramimonas_sp.AAC.1